MAKRERLRLEDAIEQAAPKKAHLFKKGAPRPEGAGRKPGQKNKVTMLLKEAIMLAAEYEGSDRQGKGGLVGFLRVLSRREPAVFGRLMEKLLPYQLTGKDGSPVQVVHSTREQLLERMKERGMPLPPSLMDMPTHSNAKQ
jgi:hypothetical protein